MKLDRAKRVADKAIGNFTMVRLGAKTIWGAGAMRSAKLTEYSWYVCNNEVICRLRKYHDGDLWITFHSTIYCDDLCKYAKSVQRGRIFASPISGVNLSDVLAEKLQAAIRRHKIHKKKIDADTIRARFHGNSVSRVREVSAVY